MGIPVHYHPHSKLILRALNTPGANKDAAHLAEYLETPELVQQLTAEFSQNLARAEKRKNRWRYAWLGIFVLVGGAQILNLERRLLLDLVSGWGISPNQFSAAIIVLGCGGIFALSKVRSIIRAKTDSVNNWREQLALLAPVTSADGQARVSRYMKRSPEIAQVWLDYALATRGVLRHFDLEMLRALTRRPTPRSC